MLCRSCLVIHGPLVPEVIVVVAEAEMMTMTATIMETNLPTQTDLARKE